MRMNKEDENNLRNVFSYLREERMRRLAEEQKIPWWHGVVVECVIWVAAVVVMALALWSLL